MRSETSHAAQRTSGGYLLRGGKKVVLQRPEADTSLVSARLGDNGLGFSSARETPGSPCGSYRMMDGRRAADVDLNDATVPTSALLGGQRGRGHVSRRCSSARLRAVRDAVGAIGAMVQATVDYAKTASSSARRSPASGPAAPQVRMRIKEEEARAVALFATLSLDGPAAIRARAISGAKAKIGRCARVVHSGGDPAPRRHRHDRMSWRWAVLPTPDRV